MLISVRTLPEPFDSFVYLVYYGSLVFISGITSLFARFRGYSTEFNNVLAAAAAATSNSSAQAVDSTRLINLLNENSTARSPAMRISIRLPSIGEEEPTRSTSEDAGDRNKGDANNGHSRRDNMALVPTGTTAAAKANREQRNAGRDYFALIPVDGTPKSTGMYCILIHF